MEDSKPKPAKAEDIKPLVEKKDTIPSIPTEPQKPIEGSKQTEEIKAQKEQERLKKIEGLRTKLGAPGTGEQVTIVQPEKSEILENQTAEKIKIEFDKELAKSMVRLSAEVQELEESLRLDKFSPISFNPESLKVFMADESIDFQKAIIAVDDLQTNLKRNFMLKNEGGTISADPHRFNRVIDSLDSLNGLLIGLRRQVDKRPTTEGELEAKKLSESLSKVINIVRKKKEDMEESQALLRRYAGR